jgi:hypothetical protein
MPAIPRQALRCLAKLFAAESDSSSMPPLRFAVDDVQRRCLPVMRRCRLAVRRYERESRDRLSEPRMERETAIHLTVATTDRLNSAACLRSHD